MAKAKRDPFNGLGDFRIKPSVAQDVEIATLRALLAVERYGGGVNPEAVESRAQKALRDIESAAQASLARIDVLDVLTVRQDLEWIERLAKGAA